MSTPDSGDARCRPAAQELAHNQHAKSQPVSPEFARAENEDDDGYDPWSDRPPTPEPMFERDPWS